MKICYLTNSLDPRAGWGRYSTDLIKGVVSAGHETIVLVEDKSRGGVAVLKRGERLFASVPLVRSFFKTADIIHALDGYPYGIIAALGNIGLKKPLVITGVGTYAVAPLYSWKLRLLMRWSYRRANVVAAISRFTASEIKKKVPGIEVKVITPGIDVAAFREGGRAEFRPRLLSVGALRPRKGYHISISAFAEAKKVIPELVYTIIAHKPETAYISHLKGLTKKHGVENEVRFLSGLSDEELKKEYRRAGLFMLTSVNEGHHFEGYGLVFLEAAAAGLPVVGTLGNGIEDAVKDGGNGILVPQNDIPATTEAIVAVVGDKSKWQRMSEQSVKWAAENETQKAVKKYLSIYAICINKR